MGLFGGILSGLGGILGDVIGGIENAHAISKASKAQQAGIQQAIGEQQREYDTSRQDFMPYMDFGKGALGPLGDLLGLNGNDAAGAAISNLQQSPLYQSLYRNGLEANLQNASATGGIRGGNEVRSLADFGSDTLAQVIQNQIQNLFGAQGVGSGATGAVTNVGMHTADNISAGDTSIGNSQFNAILGRQQAWNNMGSQINQTLMSIFGGGMGGGIGGGMSGAPATAGGFSGF